MEAGKENHGRVGAEQGAGGARRQLRRHNWIRDNSAAVRGSDSHTQSNTRHRNMHTVSHSEAHTHP